MRDDIAVRPWSNREVPRRTINSEAARFLGAEVERTRERLRRLPVLPEADDRRGIGGGRRAAKAGATDGLVNDGHGDMVNLVPDLLDPAARLLHGSPKPGGMMAGLDETFQACMFIGYHARAGETAAVRDHTINGAIVHSVSVNGREWAECDLNAAHAGSLDVPLVLVSGDDKICAHVREHQPWARTKECQPGPFLRRRDGARVAFAALVAKSDHE